MTPGDLAVSGGVIKETSPSGGANNGYYYSGRCYQDPMGTSLHWAEATHNNTASGAGFPRGVGVGVGGSDNAFTNGVIVVGSAFSGSGSTQIFTKIGTTLTSQVSATTGWATGDKIRLVITHNGTNYAYTVFKNTSTQVAQWVDTGNLIDPGVWTSIAFGCSWSLGYFPSHGATAFACGDN